MEGQVISDNDLLTRDETAAILRLSPKTLAAAGCDAVAGLPVVRLGRAVRYRRKDVYDLIERRVSGGGAGE
jgi:hypothetical protein